ncbi:DUF1116 domain-containing protein [Tissierella praeacuta]|uniref:DUF1116 domain-containing protein n=1 Tax=Tissierella praeacuta TaxID=43131 RepID=UPI002FDA300B
MRSIEEANKLVIQKMTEAQPFLVDVVPAKSVIKELNSKTLLHSGPPNTWENMVAPIQGSCIGAVLFEGWAKNEKEARKMLESGEIKFIPCHHVNAVGPMGGITSGNMPVLVVVNKTGGNVAYCTMNEGIGKVLRFGAYSQEVIDRLHWMKDVLGPSLSKALKKIDGGMNLNVIIAKAITMGDEFHQRNIAASTLFFKDIASYLIQSDINHDDLEDVMKFLADTDQFFLNIAMATCKVVMDYARTIEEGSIVTALTRNGYEFGIRVSGLGDQWFTAPVNTPQGLLFSGYSEEEISPDMGDSAITESFGLGAMAMIAAPGVTRFVGAGGFDDALAISEEMEEICISSNPNYSIPTWNFKGTCLGIDIRKVVETGITPIINTGMAHKEAGIGQIGAGTVRAPLACFEKALVALAERYGVLGDEE